jgi:hypothetical protein
MSNFNIGPSIDASYIISVHLAVSEEKNFRELTNQKPELPMAAMFLNGLGRNEQFL